MSSGRKNFTLVELVVVLVIMLLLVSLSFSSLRGESNRMILERSVREFDAWCAGVRYLCAENGVDYAVTMTSENRELRAAAVSGTDSSDVDTPMDNRSSGPRQSCWKIPEKCTLETTDALEFLPNEDGEMEFLRFYSDGGAGCVGTIVFRVEELTKYLTVSALSGRLIYSDHEPNL